MSFKLKLSPKDRATGRFMSRVHRALAKVVTEAKAETGLTQQQIADAMGVDKSVVSRILNGESNLTLKTIGDISWVLGFKPEVTFRPVEVVAGHAANHVAMQTFTAVRHEAPRVETRRPVEIKMTSGNLGSKTGSSGKPIQHVTVEKSHVH